MADERMVEAVALVRALAKDPRAREPAPRRAKVFGWAMEIVLETIAVAPSSPDAARVRGDFAVVVAAYERALEDEKVRASDVRRRLMKVLGEVGKIRDLLADGAVGRQARLRLEETLLDQGLADLHKAFVGKDKPQLARSNARVRHAAARLAARQRRGLDAAHPDVEAVTVGLRDGLIAAAGPLSPEVLAAAERAEALARGDGGLTDALVDVVRRAIDTLPQNGASHASLSPPAGLTLAWAALEMVEAWKPRGLVAAAEESNPIKVIAAQAFNVVHPHVDAPALINPIRDATAYRNAGHLALAFDGVHSREQRVRVAEDRWLARIQAEDAGSDPAAGEPDVDTTRPVRPEPPLSSPHRRAPTMLSHFEKERD